MSTATVVGSGPNGLACAVALARAGVEVTVLEAEATIGGGTRSAELTVPGVLHDVCSAFHPSGVTSPFFRSLDLEAHGLEWRWPEIDLAHPLDDGSAATMVRSLERTVAGLGADGPAWRRLFGGTVANFDAVNEEIMRPLLHLPKHPILLTRFGLNAVAPATLLTRRWQTAGARALFGGVAAHTFSPLTRP
ncbi:MAG: FAD-dependent oxidoreductase, partial [Solirubrobacterales bacterium]